MTFVKGAEKNEGYFPSIFKTLLHEHFPSLNKLFYAVS